MIARRSIAPLRVAVANSARPALSGVAPRLLSSPARAAPITARAVSLPAVRAFSNSASLRRDTSWAKKGILAYPELKPLTEQPTGEVTLIDVREPSEVAEGIIPSAVNVPLSQFAEAFNPNAPSGDFVRNFAFERPQFDDKLVFYCRSGKRSAQALEIANQGGWKNARNYEGSWLDWTAQEEARKK